MGLLQPDVGYVHRTDEYILNLFRIEDIYSIISGVDALPLGSVVLMKML